MDIILTVNIIGIIGFLLVVLAITLESLDKLKKKQDFLYLNMIGSVFLIINAYYFTVWVFVALNSFMIMANSYALFKIKKVARMKFDSLLANDLSAAVREMAGTCYSLGIKIDGKAPREFIADVKAGKYDSVLNEEI